MAYDDLFTQDAPSTGKRPYADLFGDEPSGPSALTRVADSVKSFIAPPKLSVMEDYGGATVPSKQAHAVMDNIIPPATVNVFNNRVEQAKSNLRLINPTASEADIHSLALDMASRNQAPSKPYDTRQRTAALEVAGETKGEASTNALFNQKLQNRFDHTAYQPEKATLANRMAELTAQNAPGGIERNLKSFAGGEVSAMGGLPSYVGRKIGSDTLQEVGDSMMDWGNKMQPDNPSFGNKVSSALGSMAAFYVPGLGVAKGVEAMGAFKPVMAKWLGTGTMAGMEASGEAAQVYDDNIKRGAGAADANAAADKAFWANMALLGVTDKLAFFNDIKGAGKRIAMGAVMEGPLQEAPQQVIQNQLTGRPLGEGTAESTLIGSIVGGGAAGVHAATEQPHPSIQAFTKAFNDAIQAKQFGDANQTAVRAMRTPQPPAQPINPATATMGQEPVNVDAAGMRWVKAMQDALPQQNAQRQAEIEATPAMPGFTLPDSRLLPAPKPDFIAGQDGVGTPQQVQNSELAARMAEAAQVLDKQDLGLSPDIQRLLQNLQGETNGTTDAAMPAALPPDGHSRASDEQQGSAGNVGTVSAQNIDQPAAPSSSGSLTSVPAGVAGQSGETLDVAQNVTPEAAQNIAQTPDAASENVATSATYRPMVEALIKRRAAANQVGKARTLDRAIDLAKQMMNGEDIKSGRFAVAAKQFSSDPATAAILNQIADSRKAEEKTSRAAAKAVPVAQASETAQQPQHELASRLEKFSGTGLVVKTLRSGKATKDEFAKWSAMADDFEHQVGSRSNLGVNETVGNDKQTDQSLIRTQQESSPVEESDHVADAGKVIADTQAGKSVQDENNQFNSDLDAYLNGELKSGRIFVLGKAGDILQRFGLSGFEIQMPQNIVKKGIEKHGVEAADLRDLPLHIQNPLAVFASKSNRSARILLTEITHPDGNLVVAIHAEIERGSLVIHDIRSIHPKPSEKITQWVKDGLLLGVDKNKGRHLLPATSESNSQGGDNEATSGIILYETEENGNKLWGGESVPTTASGAVPFADSARKAGEQVAMTSSQSKDNIAQNDSVTQESASIEDFGQKIEGARKDLAATISKELGDDDIATLPLGKIWPADLSDKIEDKFVAALAFAARAEIPSKPRKSYAVSRWVEKVKILRGMVNSILSSDNMRAEAEALLNEAKALEGFAAKVSLLEAIDRSQWGRIGSVGEYPDAYRYEGVGTDVKKVPTPMVKVVIDGATQYFNGVSSVADAIDQINKKLGVEAKTKMMVFEVRGTDSKGYAINKKGDIEYRKLKTFKTAKEALDYRNDHYSELVSAWEDVKNRDNVKKDDVRGKENRPRTAEDYRQGKDVTTEQFQSTFGFRGGQFGKWVSQGNNTKERQWMLNNAYDALMDLSSILDIPPKAISLNGELGMSFGARGSGAASAHYESDELVINLTKTRGAGTLAHEWFHALDNYFQRSRNAEMSNKREDRYITYLPEPMYVHKGRSTSPALTKEKLDRLHEQMPNSEQYDPQYWEKDPKHPEGVRPEVEAKFAELVQALNESPMTARAAVIDKGKSDGYWSRIIERAARSFENYVIAKMAEKGYHNDYLANVVDIAEFKRDAGRYPYLKDEELAPVVEAFDNLFGTLETSETEQGTIKLYSFPANLFDPEQWQNMAAEVDLKTGTEYASRAVNTVIDNSKRLPFTEAGPLADGEGKMTRWDKTVGTPFNLAQKDEQFAKFFWEEQAYLKDINQHISDAEAMLPTWFKGTSMAKKLVARAKGEDVASFHRVGRVMFDGTLANTVWTDVELAQRGLNDQEIHLYREAREAVDKQLAEVGSALIRKGADHDEVFARIQKLQNEGYFPLTRFGDHYVQVTDPRGETRSFQLFESAGAAKAAQSKLMREHPNHHVERGTMSRKASDLYAGISPETLELFADQLGVGNDPVFQEYLKKVVADRSAMKRMIHRKGTPGYSEDVLRVLSSFVTSNARFMSGVDHFSNMAEHAEAIDAGDVKDYAVELNDYLKNPQEEFQAIRGYAFFHFLGGNVSSALVNLSQVPLATVPYLTQHLSTAQVANIVRQSYAEALADPAKMKGEIGDALRRAEAEGITNPQNVYTMMGISAGSRLARVGEVSQLVDAWAYMFSMAEKVNRRTTFLAAYRVAQKTGLQGDEVHAFAEKAVDETQMVYNKGNRPKWARGIGAVPFTFKLFTIQFLELLGRMPPQQRMMIIASLAMLAGAEGLPFAEDIEDLIDAIGQHFGYPTNSKRWLAKHLEEGFKDFAGLPPEQAQMWSDVVRHGVFQLTPFDMGRRFGMGNIIPGTGLLKKADNSTPGQETQEIVGAVGGMFKGWYDAFGLAAQGQYERAFEKAAPVALGNIAKGVRQLASGKETTAYGNRVADINPHEAIGKMIGVQPTVVNKFYDTSGMIKQDETFLKDKEKHIVDKWARAIIEGDDTAIKEARQEWLKHNQQNPDAKINIDANQVRQRVKQMSQSGEARLIKSVARERRGGAREQLR